MKYGDFKCDWRSFKKTGELQIFQSNTKKKIHSIFSHSTLISFVNFNSFIVSYLFLFLFPNICIRTTHFVCWAHSGSLVCVKIYTFYVSKHFHSISIHNICKKLWLWRWLKHIHTQTFKHSYIPSSYALSTYLCMRNLIFTSDTEIAK